MSEVQVRVRHYDESDAAPFTTAPIEGLQRVLDQLQFWGGVNRGGDPFTNLEGQFVLDENGTYFEIVLLEDDE